MVGPARWEGVVAGVSPLAMIAESSVDFVEFWAEKGISSADLR